MIGAGWLGYGHDDLQRKRFSRWLCVFVRAHLSGGMLTPETVAGAVKDALDTLQLPKVCFEMILSGNGAV